MDDAILKSTVQSLGMGLAVVDAADWTIRFENAKFFQWFPPAPEKGEDEDEDDPADARIPGFSIEMAEKRIGRGRPYEFETDLKVGARTINLKISVRSGEGDDADHAIIECHNISKQKEVEYMLDSYSKMSERNARELQKEKDRVEKLLLNLMPRTIYEELKDYGTTTPQKFDEVTVLMLDFVGFTEMAISHDAGAVVAELNDIFSAFDRITELFDCERIKTVGDSYVAVSGLPEANPDHARNIAKVALRMRRYLEKRNASHPQTWECRIGLATGQLIGSIVGIQKYVYDIFGPAANLAARMEAHCEPMQIIITESCSKLIDDEFGTSELGTFKIKGFGEIPLYQLDFERGRR